eukprot:CAMPEP_0113277932 /NCGR_PEP_ID=MMETSP0008_2-20120614/26323_1 /TAXON_ID=97485 /ORGANISM="Prymnesium parvum" /LENGTH=60 /DNA_ID=CAMNT_0000127899 /DNA_START=315 /DNA_END=494 /DNA_ORIENTATION=+ /assembly_acc=CAM_ASM_000153
MKQQQPLGEEVVDELRLVARVADGVPHLALRVEGVRRVRAEAEAYDDFADPAARADDCGG